MGVREAMTEDRKTDSALLSALREASKRPLSEEAVRKQRVSFVMGALKPDSTVNRQKVEEVLNVMEGKKARA